MAGGTWSSQNKIRPGVYIRFKSTAGLGLTVGDRGTVAICEPMSWGPVAQVTEVELTTDLTPITGYDITDRNNRFMLEIFRGTNRTSSPNKVLLYRPPASGSAQASAQIAPLTATAKYPGARGNDISIIVTELTNPSDTFTVSTVVDGNIVDQQEAAEAEDLVSNDWVNFSGTGALSANIGTPLTGGMDGTVQSAAYSSFLTSIEPYKFDVLIYDGNDTTIQTAMQSFVERLYNDAGQYTQLVTADMTNPDSRFIINVSSGVTMSDGTVFTPSQTTWWVGGAQAGAMYNQDLTYAQYPGAVSSSPLRTSSEYEKADQSGLFTLFSDDGVVKVEYDINSLTTYTTEIGEIFHFNRTMRLCNTIANDIYQQFSERFIGVVDNNDAGRSQFKAAIVGYLLEIQGNNGIQNFSADDVEVLPGEAVDAIVVNIGIQVVGSVNKIYLTVEVS